MKNIRNYLDKHAEAASTIIVLVVVAIIILVAVCTGIEK
jgi:hypothetical protein